MMIMCIFVVITVTVAIYLLIDYIIRKQQIASLGSRYILITGCDTGFGHLAAKGFDELGCHVIAACLTDNGATKLKETCSSRLATILLDVTIPESVEKCLEFVKGILPPDKGLWGLINNAGMFGPMVPIEWMAISDYLTTFNINCLGCISMTKAFIPLVTKEKGRIVNVSSSTGRNALQHLSAYAVSKFGVEAFSDSLRRELLQFGVSVHIIEPGGYKTNLLYQKQELTERAWNRLTPDVQAKYGVKLFHRLKKPATSLSCNPDDVVDAFKHALLSLHPRARYVIGWDAKLVIIPLQWLPEWIGDWLILAITNRKCD